MGPRATSTSSAAICAAALLVSCSDDDGITLQSFECASQGIGGGESIDGPPSLADATMADLGTVRLVFTEAMAPIEEIDPSAFRLSLATANLGDFYGTYYRDLGQLLGGAPCPPMAGVEECCFEVCSNDGCVPMCVPASAPLEIVGVCNDTDDPNALTLHLSEDLPEEICGYIEGSRMLLEMYDGEYGGGLFVHYSDAKIPITDAQGERLAPIAAHWAVTDDPYAFSEETFPALDPLLPISCPG